MARPEKFEDLPSYDQRPTVIASLETSAFAVVSAPMVRALAEVLAVARQEGLTVSESGEVAWSLSDEVKAKRLSAHQSDWDSRQKVYERALSEPWLLGAWEWAVADNHAEKEGLPKAQRLDEEEQDA